MRGWKRVFIFLFVCVGGCSTVPSSLPWLDVEWKRTYEVAKNGATTYYYGGEFFTFTFTKSLFVCQYYTNAKLSLKQTYPVVGVDEAKTLLSYDCSTTTETRIGVVMCKVTTNKMEVTNFVIYITNKTTSAASTSDQMPELSAIGFEPK
ncbi:MAG: hypothetical protein N2314_09140 [Brevinematales bacterium]|nr:hypothetical protein [Brevinematales bacterium]